VHAGQAEDDADAGALQRRDEDLGAGHRASVW
jgi:hypothetical protein